MPASLDLIMPLYHPRAGWEKPIIRSLKELEPFLRDNSIELNVFLVNDGSPLSDYDPAALKSLEESFPGFHFLSYENNRGKGHCLRYGMAHSKADFLLYTDADFPFGTAPLAAAGELLLSGQADVVMGSRSADYHRALNPRRKVISHAVRMMNRFLLGMPRGICDTQAGLKGFNAAGKRCFMATQTDSFIFDTEFIFYSYKSKLRIAPVPVKLQKDLHFAQVGIKTIMKETVNFGAIFVKYIFGKTPVAANGKEEK